MTYIVENGIVKPNLLNRVLTFGNAVSRALTIISSMQDVHALQNLYVNNQPMQLSSSTLSSMKIMQGLEFLNRFQLPATQPITQRDSVLNGLSNVFARYGITIGLMYPLLELSGSNLNFIIDDSPNISLQSVLNRLRVMTEILAYIPFNQMRISF